MGTSQSSPGPGGKSPLIPPWADDTPEQPLPNSGNRRYASFRESLGRAVSNGSSSDLRKAVGHYAKTSSGGSAAAVRRLGSATSAGSQLFGLLTSGSGTGTSAINLDSLNGLPVDIAISRITQSLATEDGDSEKIKAAMNLALAEALEGIEIFDSQNVTAEIITNTMINYLCGVIFVQLMMDSGGAFDKAETPKQAIHIENSLYSLVDVIVNEHMAERLSNNISTLTQVQVKEIQRQTIIDVWTEWENYA